MVSGEIQKRSRLRIGHLPRTISMSSHPDFEQTQFHRSEENHWETHFDRPEGWIQFGRLCDFDIVKTVHFDQTFIDPLWASSSG